MSKSIKVTLPTDIKAQLDYEASLLGMTSNKYAAHLITQALINQLSSKSEVHETLQHLNYMLSEAFGLLEVLTDTNQREEKQ